MDTSLKLTTIVGLMVPLGPGGGGGGQCTQNFDGGMLSCTLHPDDIWGQKF